MKGILILFVFGHVYLSTADEPEKFFELLRENKEVDLVLAIDRSFAMGRDSFYLVAKKLAHDIIRHHVWMQPDQVRVAVVTIGTDTKIAVDGIRTLQNTTKCELLPQDPGNTGVNPPPSLWDDLRYDPDHDCTFPENVRENAYNAAHGILRQGFDHRPNAKRIVLLITVPICADGYENIEAAEKKVLSTGDAYIFPIELTIKAGSTVRESPLWTEAVRVTSPILDITKGGQVQTMMVNACANDTGYCDTTTGFTHCDESGLKGCLNEPCLNDGRCYDDSDSKFAVCRCPLGFTGRYCGRIDNPCDIIEGACTDRNLCKRNDYSYTCSNDAYSFTNPNNCTIFRNNCPEDEKKPLKWIAVGVPVGIVVLIIFGATFYACFKICCSKDRAESRQKVVKRVVQMRDSVHAVGRNVRQSVFGGPMPPLPPKSENRRPTVAGVGSLDPEAGKRSAPVSSATPVAIVQPTPVQPLIRPRTQPMLPSVGELSASSRPQPFLPPEAPPIITNRPPAVLLQGLLRNKNDIRESSSDYLQPQDGPYGRQGYDNPCDVMEGETGEDESDVGDYEGEFDDFYDYAWKTGQLQPTEQYLHLVSDPSIPLPSAPVNRPDIVLDNQNSRRNRPVGTDGYGWAPLQKDMLSWQNYVCDLTDSGDGMDLDRVCILQVDGLRWIASDNSLRPTDDQLADLWNAFHQKLRNNTKIKLGSGKERTFAITENDGVLIKGVGGKDKSKDENLCATRTKQYIVLAGLARSRDKGQLESEVSHIKQHLLASE